MPSPTRPLAYKRFSVASTIYGWEVEDSDGRSVTESFEAPDLAAQVMDSLNAAAANGPRALATALGAVEEAVLV